MKVIVAGEMPFVQQVGQLCLAAGHDTTILLVEDFLAAIESGYEFELIAKAEIIIELHNESAAAKQELLMALEANAPDDILFMTSALAISATQAASWTVKPGRVVGFGVMPPLKGDGIVELAAGLQTEENALAEASLFWRGLGYKPMVVADGPGLVRARLVCCLINEATSALMEGVATAADIDQAMWLGTNHPMGPLEWADYLGLDMVLGVMTGLFNEWGDDRYRPSPLLRRMVQAGRLGKKAGRGFYKYGDE